MEPVSKLLDSAGDNLLSGKNPIVTLLMWSLVVPFLTYCVTVVVHELGHLVAGWSMGFRFISIRFGPVKIMPGPRVSLSREAPKGGLTLMALKSHRLGRTRTIIFSFGGSVANLICAGVIIAVDPASSPFVSLFAALSLIVGIANLVPIRTRGWPTDGRKIVMLLFRRSAETDRGIALLQFAAAAKNGGAVEDLPPEMISALIGARDPSAATVVAHMVAYTASWESGPDPETARRLEIALQFSSCASPKIREMVVCAAGLFQAERKNNVILAREWQTEIPEPALRPDSRLRIEVSILEAEHDFNGALEKLAEIEKMTPQSERSNADWKRLQRWRSKVEEKAKLSNATSTTI